MKRRVPIGCLTLLLLGILACNAGLPTATPSPEAPAPPTATATELVPTDTIPPPPPPTDTPEPTPEPTAVPTLVPTPVATAVPVEITFITMITTSVGWGIGSPSGADNHVLRTRDGGNTWEDVTPPEPALGSKHAVGFFLNAKTAWVTYHPTIVGTPPATFYTWHTTNGGVTWSKSTTHSVEFIGSNDHPPYIHFSDANRGWVVLRNGPAGMHRYPVYLMSTSDGGATWSMLIDAVGGLYLQSCQKTGVDFWGDLVGWATYDNCPTTEPRLLTSGDGGSTWSEIVLPPPASEPDLFTKAFCFSYSPNLLCPTCGALWVHCSLASDPSTAIDYVYRTSDGGGTWQTYSYPGGPLLYLNSNYALALGRKIHKSEDGGATWAQISTTSWDGQFSFVSHLYAWAVARSGSSIALVKSANAASSWAILSPVLEP